MDQKVTETTTNTTPTQEVQTIETTHTSNVQAVHPGNRYQKIFLLVDTILLNLFPPTPVDCTTMNYGITPCFGFEELEYINYSVSIGVIVALILPFIFYKRFMRLRPYHVILLSTALITLLLLSSYVL